MRKALTAFRILTLNTQMDLNEADKLWFNSEPIDGVLFAYNDYVQIKSGEFAGEGASIISLISLEPVSYLVELDLPKGGDIKISQTEIEKTQE